MYLNLKFLLVFIIFGFFSCSDDSDDQSLHGTYKITAFENSNCSDPRLNAAFDIPEDGCISQNGQRLCIDGTLTITEDNCFALKMEINVSGTSFSQNLDGLISNFTESEFTLCFKDGTGCGTAKYSLENNAIEINVPFDETDACDIRIEGDKIES